METSQIQSKIRAFVILNGTEIYPLSKDVTSLGRMDDNDIVLSSSHVSRYHAQIRRAGEAFLVVDLNSTSGTCVNGNPVGEKLLRPGDVITLAGVPVLYGETAEEGVLEDAEQHAGSPGGIGETDAVEIGSLDRYLELFETEDPKTG